MSKINDFILKESITLWRNKMSPILKYSDKIPDGIALPGVKEYHIEVITGEPWPNVIVVCVSFYYLGSGWLDDEAYELTINEYTCKIPEFKRFPKEVRTSILSGVYLVRGLQKQYYYNIKTSKSLSLDKLFGDEGE